MLVCPSFVVSETSSTLRPFQLIDLVKSACVGEALLLFQIFLLDCSMSVHCDPVVCRACLTVAASMGTGRAAADA